MKYVVDSKCRKIAIVRNYVFKSLLALFWAMLFFTSNAAVPTAVKTIFDCTEQKLVKVVAGYEYRLVDEEGNVGGWSTASPEKRNVGEYTIEYRAVGSSTVKPLKSTISPRTLYLNVLEDHFIYNGVDCFCAKAEIKEDEYTKKCDIAISQMAPCRSTPGVHKSWFQIVMGEDRDNFVLESQEVPFWVQKEIELKWSKLSTTYNAGYQVPTVEIDPDDLIEDYTDVSISSACSALNREKYKNAGSYSVEVELEGSGAEAYKVTNATETFVINKKAVDYKPKTSGSWTYYDGTYPMPEVTTYYNGFCSADAGKVSLSVESNYKDAGTYKYPVIIIGEAKDNYTLSNANASISHTIRQRSVYYDIVKNEFTYDGKPHSVEISIREPNEGEKSGFISGDDVTWGLSDNPTAGTVHVPGKNVGHYVTNVVFTGKDADNYLPGGPQASSSVSYDITPIEVKWRHTNEYPQSYYTGSKQRPPLGVVPYSNGFINGEDAYFSTTEQYREPGDYTYEVIIEGADKDNYVLGNNSNELKWKILPRDVNFNISNTSFLYDGEPHIAEVTAIPASNTEYGDRHGFVEGDDISWHLSGELQKNVGRYTVSIIFEGADKDNYSVGLTVNSITYQITPKELSLNCNKKTFSYSGGVQLPKVELEGVVAADEGSIKTTLSLVAGDDGKSVGNHYANVAITGEEKVLANYTLPEELTVLYKIHALEYDAPEERVLTYNGSEQELVTAGKATTIKGTFWYGTSKDDLKENDIPRARNASGESQNYIVYYQFVPTDKAIAPSPVENLIVNIGRQPLDMEWEGEKTVEYDGNLHSLTPVITSGLIEGDEVEFDEKYIPSYIKANTEGYRYILYHDYNNTSIVGKEASNYILNAKEATLKIIPKKLTVNLVRNTFTYSGDVQLPEVKLEGVVPADEGLIKATVSLAAGDDGKSVGTHYANVAIAGDEKVLANYIWNDAAYQGNVYSFEIIEKNEFKFHSVKQSDNSTPGSTTTLSYEVEGGVYECWITCNSCRAFNTDTIPLNGSLASLDIFIPDTVKPGRYDLAITFRSEDYDTTTTVQLRVDYPATDIYIMWKNILAIDNSDDVFKTYQWYKNGEEIPDATLQYYQDINGIEGYYSCLVNGEFTIGPAFFHSGKPLWIKTNAGIGTLDVEVVGTLPAQTTLIVYNHTGMIVASITAEQFNHFNLSAGIYFVKLTGKNLLKSEQSVKVLIK